MKVTKELVYLMCIISFMFTGYLVNAQMKGMKMPESRVDKVSKYDYKTTIK